MNTLSPQKFRQKLAGLINPADKLPDKFEKEDVKQTAIRLVSILPSLYSDDLDRLKLWDRIGTGILSGVPKSDSDIYQYINCIVAHVKADHGKVAGSQPLNSVIQHVQTRPSEWHDEFLRYIEKNHYVVLMSARLRWEQYKSKVVEL